jgi:hypothetical protein
LKARRLVHKPDHGARGSPSGGMEARGW